MYYHRVYCRDLAPSYISDLGLPSHLCNIKPEVRRHAHARDESQSHIS